MAAGDTDPTTPGDRDPGGELTGTSDAELCAMFTDWVKAHDTTIEDLIGMVRARLDNAYLLGRAARAQRPGLAHDGPVGIYIDPRTGHVPNPPGPGRREAVPLDDPGGATGA